VAVDRLAQRSVAEGIGTGLLLAAVVGSGIMAERLAGGNKGLALLANTLATAGALVALILAFGPVSGAHLNPAVTLVLAARHHPQATPAAVACVIAAAYWFTSSTSFANPAVTVARALSDTFAGIRSADAPAFVAAQLLGAAAATALFAWFEEEGLPAVGRPLSGPSEALGEGG
jgi:glycerol uptake facilitator-like aquaporin